jgi:hypothetical protein
MAALFVCDIKYPFVFIAIDSQWLSEATLLLREQPLLGCFLFLIDGQIGLAKMVDQGQKINPSHKR